MYGDNLAETLFAMLLNPVINLILVALSLLFGIAALTETNSWMVMLPFLFFTVLFSVSLFRKVKI